MHQYLQQLLQKLKIISNKPKVLGLRDKDIDTLLHIAKNIEGVLKVVIFGSRAVGNFKNISDVDICIMVQDKKSYTLFMEGLEDSNLPYMYDVVNFDEIHNENLKNKIKKEGIMLFDK